MPTRSSSAWPRRLAVLAGITLLVGFVYAPISTAKFWGNDYPALARVSEFAPDGTLGWLEGLSSVPGAEGHPLAGAALVLFRWMHADEGRWTVSAAPGIRIGNVLLMLATCAWLGCFARRLLRPYTGRDHANAAGFASALLLAVHPLTVTTVAGISARGMLVGAALAAGAVACFLRGRQERSYPFTVLAALLTVLTGLAADASGLPLVLAAAEYFSSARLVPRRTRLRTTVVTLLVFGLCAAVGPLLRMSVLAVEGPSEVVRALGGISSWTDLGLAFVVFFEKLGLLCVPVSAYGYGVVGYTGAGLLLLLGVQPAVVAARSAPRLWWTLAGAWCLLLVFAEFSSLMVRVQPRDFSSVHVLFPAAGVMSIGLGVACTALSDVRRAILPWALAIGYAFVAQSNSMSVVDGARRVDLLRSELAAAKGEHGEVDFLVVEPPWSVQGVDPIGSALPWLLHPSFAQAGEDPSRAAVHGLTRAGFAALTRQPEFDALRRGGLVVLGPEGQLGAVAPRRTALRVAPAGPAQDPPRALEWSGTSAVQGLDLDALGIRGLLLEAAPGTVADGSPEVSWTASELPGGRDEGAWIGAGPRLMASFDVGSDLGWLLSGRVRSLAFDVGPGTAAVRALAALPALDAEAPPRTDGDDWLLAVPDAGLVRATQHTGEFVLGILELDTLAYTEFEPRESSAGELRFEDAAELHDTVHERGAGLAWTLDYRLRGVPVARDEGRMDARAGPRLEGTGR